MFISGTALGTVIAILLSGMIAATLGWEWVFYIEALLCLIWCAAWIVIVQDSPEQQRIIISNDEREYIMNSLGHTKESHKIVSISSLANFWNFFLRIQDLMGVSNN